MPDYSMCLNDKCSQRLSCARYRMKSNSQYQTITCFTEDMNHNCDGLWYVVDAPWRCYTKKEMREFEANKINLKKCKVEELNNGNA